MHESVGFPMMPRNGHHVNLDFEVKGFCLFDTSLRVRTHLMWPEIPPLLKHGLPSAQIGLFFQKSVHIFSNKTDLFLCGFSKYRYLRYTVTFVTHVRRNYP